MNLKTTIVLAVLVAAGALGWYVWHTKQPTEKVGPTAAFLKDELKADALTRIEVKRGSNSYVLERKGPGQEWTLPGQWPAREREVEQLVRAITQISSRFAPLPIDDKKALLDRDPLVLKLSVEGKPHVLVLVDEPSETNRFTRPTYLRLDENDEVLRVAPGLVEALDRGEEYFRKRRLFETERVAKDDSQEKIAQVAAVAVEISRQPDAGEPSKKAKEEPLKIAKKGDDWELIQPVRDRLDPEKVRDLLTALPNLWAENLIQRKGRSLEELGLDPPRMTVKVTRPSGTVLDLRIGAVARTEVRKEIKPGMPIQPGMPPEPRVELITEEYRYAKLATNDLLFEIKAEKLEDRVPADPLKLRDPRLARFEPGDVKRLDVQHGADKVQLAFAGDKGKETWKLPGDLPADETQVRELLRKLADLEARDKSIVDDADLARYGLDKPLAVVTIAAEETKGTGADKKTTAKNFTVRFGTSAKEKGKLYAQVDGWPRINAVDDALVALIERPAIAYRSRKLLDQDGWDVARIDIRRQDDVFSFTQAASTWTLAAPVKADVDSSKVYALADHLARLKVVEFVAADPKPEDLDKVYGLVKPTLQAEFTFASKKSHTLAIGNKKETREPKDKAEKEPKFKFPPIDKKEKDKEKEEYYARLDQGPVFVVDKDLHDVLNRDSLAYHAEKPFDVQVANIAEIEVRKGADKVHLKRNDKAWQIHSPFQAPASPQLAEGIATQLAELKVGRYVAHFAKEPGDFGLDKPYLEVRVVASKQAKESTLVIGAKVKDSSDRYARAGSKQAVFTVSEADLADLDRKPLDLLSREVLRLDPNDVQTIRVAGPMAFTLERQPDGWRVVDAPVPPFPAEPERVQDILQTVKDLRAARVVVYGAKDLAMYGLDNPAVKLTLVAKGAKDAKTEHVLALGKEAEGGQRYAQLDKGPAIFLLDEFIVKDLTAGYLDFVSLALMKAPAENVVGLVRHMPGNDFDLQRKGETWSFKDRPADLPTILDVLRQTQSLRAQRIAEYPVKNLAAFGLDKPAAVVTLKLEDADGKPSEHVIKLGKPAGDKKDTGHFAIVDKGDRVVVLGPELSRRLLGPAVNFGDHHVAKVFGADQAVFERTSPDAPTVSRKAVFTRVDGVWKMTDPVKADAEEVPLFDLIGKLSRLRADDIVAEKADPKLYGLERPPIQWKLRFADQDVLTLQVGNAEPPNQALPPPRGREGVGGPRHYARIAGKDLIFLLDPVLSAKVQEEYRKRKPWDDFDAVQVEKISIQGKQPFTLVKVGKDWLVPTMPAAKIDSRVVSDTLDTLARLEVLRYVADQKADLQLHGLVPPALAIEVETAGGRRSLLIGRYEGTSQRPYATVPGSDTIFVLTEADAQKLLRPLSAYAPGAKESKGP